MHEMELFFITNAKKRFSSIDNPSGSPETAFLNGNGQWKTLFCKFCQMQKHHNDKTNSEMQTEMKNV